MCCINTDKIEKLIKVLSNMTLQEVLEYNSKLNYLNYHKDNFNVALYPLAMYNECVKVNPTLTDYTMLALELCTLSMIELGWLQQCLYSCGASVSVGLVPPPPKCSGSLIACDKNVK